MEGRREERKRGGGWVRGRERRMDGEREGGQEGGIKGWRDGWKWELG